MLAEKVSQTPGNPGRRLLVAQEEWASVHRAKRDAALLALSNRVALDRIRTEEGKVPHMKGSATKQDRPHTSHLIPDLAAASTTTPEVPSRSPLGAYVSPSKRQSMDYDAVVQQSEEIESSLREWMLNITKSSPDRSPSKTTPSRTGSSAKPSPLPNTNKI